MVTPYKEIEKYIKIRALATRGVAGEKANALQMLRRLEQKYPNIVNDVKRFEQVLNSESGSTSHHSTEQTRHWSDVYREQQEAKKRSNQWSQWGNMASQAFDWATNMASQAFGRMYAHDLSMEAVISVRSNPSGSKTINIKIEPSTLQQIRQMDDEQRMTFCNALAEQFCQKTYTEL